MQPDVISPCWPVGQAGGQAGATCRKLCLMQPGTAPFGASPRPALAATHHEAVQHRVIGHELLAVELGSGAQPAKKLPVQGVSAAGLVLLLAGRRGCAGLALAAAARQHAHKLACCLSLVTTA